MFLRIFLLYYVYAYASGFGAPTGQTDAHAPHSIQQSASITKIPSPSEIQLTGHSASHAPQLIQSSLIRYAIAKTPPFILL